MLCDLLHSCYCYPDTANSRLADNLLLQTPRYYRQELKSWRRKTLPKNNSHYYGLSRLQTPNVGASGVYYNESWLHQVVWVMMMVVMRSPLCCTAISLGKWVFTLRYNVERGCIRTHDFSTQLLSNKSQYFKFVLLFFAGKVWPWYAMRDSQQNKLGGFSWKVTVSSENNSCLQLILHTRHRKTRRFQACCNVSPELLQSVSYSYNMEQKNYANPQLA